MITRKWLLEAPLAPLARRRLELGLAMTLSAAAVVALSAVVAPSPAKLAELHHAQPLRSSPVPRRAEPERRDMTSAMHAAAAAGDVRGMTAAYRPGMLLEDALVDAAASKKVEAMRWLLDHGADVHHQEHSQSAPMLVADDSPEIAKLLRERGAIEPDLTTAAVANAPNAFFRALPKASPGLYDVALRNASFATTGETANKIRIMTRLLDLGADPNATQGDTALAGAVHNCDIGYRTSDHECLLPVRLLLDRGARVEGDSLAAALVLQEPRRSMLLDHLLEQPLAKGATAHALAESGNLAAEDVKRLVAKGIDWAWHDGEDDAARPVLEAVRRGDRDGLRALFDARAPVDVHYKDGAATLAAAIDLNDDDHARVVELLVERGANPNRRFPDGRTPLYAAAEQGDIRVVNFLLAHGARPNDAVLDETALDAAEQHGNIPAARVIAAHGGQRRQYPRTID